MSMSGPDAIRTPRDPRLRSPDRRRCIGSILAAVAAAAGGRSLRAAPIRVSVDEARRVTEAATQHGGAWKGPVSGPAAPRGKTVVVLAEDLRNGGIVGVAQGMREAAAVMDWRLKVMDCGSTPQGRTQALAQALSARPDGLVVCGSDAVGLGPQLQAFAALGVPVVGWHAGPAPGPITGTPVAMNVSTDPIDVARVTAMAAIAQSDGRAGVVVFTDSRFRIAMAKASEMIAVIRSCPGCQVLDVLDIPLSEADARMPAVTRGLVARFGRRWTHALAINDVVFDRAVPELISAGVPTQSLSLLSAGDGSAAAFLRIQAGTYQTGTVAEPLAMHGWQVLDEINRLIAHQPASGFVAPVHLITAADIDFDGGTHLQYDPQNGYRDAYRRIWRR